MHTWPDAAPSLARRDPHTDRVPNGWRDLRGVPPGGSPAALRYPPGAVLLVAGVPGAGKSTLLHRIFGLTGTERRPVDLPGGTVVLDSEQARNRWRDRLGARVPYPAYRPLVHLAHHVAALRRIRRGGGMVLHDCGTRSWWRWLLLRAARARRTPAHLLLIDVSAAAALDGQRRRRRSVRSRSFRRHVRRWSRLLAARPGRGGPDDFASCLVFDRAGAARLRAVSFAPAPALPRQRPADVAHGTGAPVGETVR